jgi:hypothetical protein
LEWGLTVRPALQRALVHLTFVMGLLIQTSSCCDAKQFVEDRLFSRVRPSQLPKLSKYVSTVFEEEINAGWKLVAVQEHRVQLYLS